MKDTRALVFLCIGMLFTCSAFAQGSPEYGSGMRVNMNQEGTKYLRFIFWNQIWARSTKHNPGTLVAGEPADRTFDIGARRIRFLALAQISPRYLIVAHAGINNQTFVTGGGSGTTGTGPYGAGKKPQIFFHDVYNEYAVIPAKNPETGKANKNTLSIGAGLHYWHGISRMTSASTLNFLMIDAPIFNWPLIEVSDQFARQFGIYAKGTMGKLHYQMHVNKPFATNNTPTVGGPAVDNNGNAKAGYGGYYDYQFLDQESNVLPFRVGSYVGTKKVFNIGGGFYSSKEGTKSLTATDQVRKHNINIQAVDFFADLPVGDKNKNMAVTAYSSLYNYDFGPNYLRSLGIMNIGTSNPNFTGRKAQQGAGNARYLLGTGQIWYTQTGLLLPKTISTKLRIQPIAAYTLTNFQGLSDVGHHYDLGSNFYIDGHHSKLTLQYSSRPLYNNNRVFSRAGEWQMQFQVYL